MAVTAAVDGFLKITGGSISGPSATRNQAATLTNNGQGTWATGDVTVCNRFDNAGTLTVSPGVGSAVRLNGSTTSQFNNSGPVRVTSGPTWGGGSPAP